MQTPHVALSFIGADRLDSGYFRGKVAQEQLAAEVLRDARDPRRVGPDTSALFMGARVHADDESLLPAWTVTTGSYRQWRSEAS